MIITITPPEDDSSQVSVCFEHEDITHTRMVNVVFVEGVYDADATEERCNEVGRGILHKIDIGLISAAPDPQPD